MSFNPITVVLFDTADRRLAQVRVPPDVNVVDYAGAFYILTDKTVQVAGGAWVPVFEPPVIHKVEP